MSQLFLSLVLATQTGVKLQGESLAWDNVRTRFEKKKFSWLEPIPRNYKDSSKNVQSSLERYSTSKEGLQEAIQGAFKSAIDPITNTRSNMLKLTVLCYYQNVSGRNVPWSYCERVLNYWDNIKTLDIIEYRWLMYMITSCYPQAWQINYLKKLQLHFPNNAMHDLHIIRLAYMDKNEWEYAMQLGSKWSKIYPEYGTIHGNFGRFLLDIGEKARRKEWVLKSIESFEKGIASKICFDSYRETMKMHLRAARELAKEL